MCFCRYLLPPHHFKTRDKALMKKLARRMPVIPVLAKVTRPHELIEAVWGAAKGTLPQRWGWLPLCSHWRVLGAVKCSPALTRVQCLHCRLMP